MSGAADRLGVQPLHRGRLVDAVTDQLRELIVTNQIEPGTRLLQIDVAEQLGVSRTPLREALRVLEREGLVRISNGNNTVEVVRFDFQEVKDVLELREVLDGLAARLAARRGLSPSADAELATLCEQLGRAANVPADSRHLVDLHVRFHAVIVQESGNPRLDALLPLLQLSTQAVTLKLVDESREIPSRVAEILAESERHHREIYQAMRDRNERLAESLARKHIRQTMKSWLLTDG